MKIAFVQPPNLQREGEWKKRRVSRPPINIALLAACVRQFGHQPVIYDLDWFEGSVNDMATIILSEKPDAVGFTCLTPRLQITLSIAERLKQLNPEIKIVIGGAHVNGLKEKAVYEDIDYMICGEAEDKLVNLLDYIETGRGFEALYSPTFRQNLDELPFPAWDLLNLQEYEDPATFDGIHMGVMTARGCPWNCIFCSSGVTWGRKVRYRSAENVIEELEQIVELGIRNIMFYDDTFTLNKPRFLRICEGMVGLNLKYYCQLRVDTVDEEIAYALKRSGCIGAAIGVESGDEEILKILQKGFKKSQVYGAVKVLKSARVPIIASYILGSPDETHESIKKTFNFARELDTDQTKFMICTPFPGTALFDIAVERGLLSYDMTPSQYAETTYYQHVVANLSKVSDEDLINYQNEAYREFEQRPLVKSHDLCV